MGDEYRIEALGLRKSFGRATALLGADFSLRQGEIHALIGAEGAGKSTLIGILAGLCAPDGGSLRIDGRAVRLESPADSIRNGISAALGVSGLVPGLSVAENIFLGVPRAGGGLLDGRGMRRRAEGLLGEAGFGHIRPDAAAGGLDAASAQIVEICRVMARGSRVLLLDDPAAELSMKEAERLFGLAKRLRAGGMSIVIACGHAADAFAVADRLTALSGGLSSPPAAVPSAEAVDLAVAAAGGPKALFPPRRAELGGCVVKAERIGAGGISFEAREGEILGLTGLAGDGRREAVDAVFGGPPSGVGTLSVGGRAARLGSPEGLAGLGVAFLPEEYRRRGPSPAAFGEDGTGLGRAFLESLAGLGGEFAAIARRQARLPDRGRQQDADAEAASRGDRQRAALEALNAGGARVVVLDEPTRGLNADARTAIYRIMGDMAEGRRAVIMVSSELGDVAGLCDRAVVVRDGASVCELVKDELSEAGILMRAAGVVT